MRPRRLIDCRQVRLGRKQQRDDTHPMSLFSSRGLSPWTTVSLAVLFLILTCPIQTRPELECCLRTGVSSWLSCFFPPDPNLSNVSVGLKICVRTGVSSWFSVDRALLSQRVPAVWPDDGLRPAIPSHQLLTHNSRSRSTNYSLNPTLAPADCPTGLVISDWWENSR